MSKLDEDRDPLEVLAAEFTARQRRGESPSISEYVAKHPELAAEIEELFPAIAAMERLKTHRRQSQSGRVSLGAMRLERLGDFRIQREIGRGGMGIVYEAFQESLGRHVAVKVLPRQSLLDPKQLQRFQREAQTAAKLHHTNIVPVFGVGEHEGFHYIVMQLIRGVGLDAVLATLQRVARGGAPGEEVLEAQDLHETAKRKWDAGWPPGSGSAPHRDLGSEVASMARALVEGRLLHAGDLKAGGTESPVRKPPSPARGRGAGGEGTLNCAEIFQSFTPSDSPIKRERGSVGPDSDQPASGARPPGVASAAAWRFGPAYWRSAARIALQVAEALHNAHLHQTLHRDVKPANLILDWHGVVWVTDFGLAKAMEHEQVTQAGALVGTLRYMAPEQLVGRVDARSDVYSLGLTLYELLCLRPAFEGADRSSLIQKIMHAEPVRPRKLNPAIPRDLETIVLKSIAREPAARYQSAGQMAEDLQRFLDDRPVLARRIAPPERLWRWCRRNPVTASLTSAVLLLVVLAAAIATIGYVQTKTAWLRESQQRVRAEATTELALEALDKIFRQFAPDRIADPSGMRLEDAQGQSVEVPTEPVISNETAAVLEQMLGFYSRLGEQGGDDSRLRERVADANRRVGDIRRRLGDFSSAIAAYERAIGTYRDLRRSSPEDTELLVETASVYNDLGVVYHAIDKRGRDAASHRQALTLLKAAPPEAQGSPGLRYELARTYYFLGRTRVFGPGPPPPGGGRGPRPPERNRSDTPMPKPPPGGEAGTSYPSANGQQERGSGRRGTGAGFPQPKPASTAGQEDIATAIHLLEELVDQYPAIPEYRHLLAQCYRDLHPAAFIFGRQAALDANNKAIEILETLVHDFPQVADYRYALSQTYADPPPPDRDSLLSGDFAALAEERYRMALRISEELVAEHPNVPEFAASQADILLKLHGLLYWSGRPKEAEKTLREALDVQASLAGRFPKVLRYRIQPAFTEYWLADLLRDRGELAAARPLLESSIARIEQIAGSDPPAWPFGGMLAFHYSELARLLRQMNEAEAAAAAQRRADELRRPMPPPQPRPPRQH